MNRRRRPVDGWPPRHPGEPAYDPWADERRGCLDGPGRFAFGVVLFGLAIVLVLASGWVRTDRAVARCVENPVAVGCAPPGGGADGSGR